MKLTDNQRRVLRNVRDERDYKPGHYLSYDGNEDRTLRSLGRRGLVKQVLGREWWAITDEGRKALAGG